MKYEVIIYWSEDDQAFIAEVPELPGCMADGRTYAEAVANAEVIIDEWIETARNLGRPIPEPREKLAYAQISKLSTTCLPRRTFGEAGHAVKTKAGHRSLITSHFPHANAAQPLSKGRHSARSARFPLPENKE